MSKVLLNSLMTFMIAGLPVTMQAQEALQAREQAARQAAGVFMKELGGTLKAEMEKGGPAEAIGVCQDVAPAIANRLSLENGWKVTRVGTRVRNPMLGMPDAWEQQILQQFQARIEQGESFDGMSHWEVVQEPRGRYFRYMKPLGVAPLCITCHGTEEQIPEAVKTALQTHYPHDQAVGYQTGDLRGAISIKQPVASAEAESIDN